MKKFFAPFAVCALATFVLFWVFPAIAGSPHASPELAGWIFLGTMVGAIFGGWIFHVTLRKGGAYGQERLGIFFGVMCGDAVYSSLFQEALLGNVLVQLCITAVFFFGSYALAVTLRQKQEKKREV